MDDILDQIITAWRTNNRVNLFLIEHVSDEGMRCTLSTRGGRNVVRQFAHLHNVRVWHLENRARELAKDLHVFATHDEPNRETLAKHLNVSADKVERFLIDCAEGVPKRRCFKKGVVANLGYFISHESHHRGNILLTLKQCGHGLDKKTQYAIWNWDKI